mmetsp:Transcript_35311/g.54232  ORF Transcript_35311/g.54232 Transcript_35311/m.54232 type:complete len:230 (+) Transcript_35311:141-830(+)
MHHVFTYSVVTMVQHGSMIYGCLTLKQNTGLASKNHPILIRMHSRVQELSMVRYHLDDSDTYLLYTMESLFSLVDSMVPAGSTICTNSTFAPKHGPKSMPTGRFPRYDLVPLGPRTIPTFTSRVDTTESNARPISLPATFKPTPGPKCPVAGPFLLLVIFILVVCTATKCMPTEDTLETNDWRICMPMISKRTIGVKSIVHREIVPADDRLLWHKSTRILFMYLVDTMV